MKRLAKLVTTVVAVGAWSLNADQPLNILFIAIDDMKPIGTVFNEDPGNFLQHVYPDKALRTEVAQRMTPNIQRLADEGISFMDAYCAAPACNPSRAAIMTGIRPHKSGLTTNAGGTFFRDYEYEGVKYLADATTMAEHLRHNGWYTASTGKIFHNRSSYEMADGPRSWTDWTDVGGGAGEKAPSAWRTDELDWGQEGDDRATYKELNDYRKADFMARVLEEGKATDGDTTFAVSPDQPFFLALGIFRPHLPYYATRDLLDLFPVEEMNITRELLDEFIKDGDDVPEFAFSWSGLARNDEGDAVLGNDRFTRVLSNGLALDAEDGDLKAWKDMLMHYFASCAIADRSVGRVLDGLENSPYRDNTMVILWSDHGYHLGEKLHVSKFALWDDAAQVNFFIKDPRNPQSAGRRCFRPVSLIDIYPTVMQAAGLDLPDARITGHDLTPLLQDPGAPRNIPAQSTYGEVTNNMIRSEPFKLIQYSDGSREIYNVETDPEEYENLSGKSELEDEENKLETLLNIAIEEGTYPDEQAMSLPSWRRGYWGSPEDREPARLLDDPDKDSVLNFAEFALGTDPLKSNPLGDKFPQTELYPDFNYLFPLREGEAALHYKVQHSTTLNDWQVIFDSKTDSLSELESKDGPNGTRLVKIPVEPANGSFLQLIVSTIGS